jgi:hypothetical protein
LFELSVILSSFVFRWKKRKEMAADDEPSIV